MKILVYGSREFGRVVRALTDDCGHDFGGFVDDNHSGGEIVGPYEQVRQRCQPADYAFAVAIGYRHLDGRWSVFQRLLRDGFAVPSLIHPEVYVHGSTTIGSGAMIMARACVDVHASIGDIAVMWPGAMVSHDSAVGANTFLSPNCTVCGASTVGSNCFIGAGAVVADHRNVPDRSFVKAGGLFK